MISEAINADPQGSRPELALPKESPLRTQTVSFHGFSAVFTSAEVIAAIRAQHGESLGVYSSFSDPEGSSQGGTYARMETTWALPTAEQPLIGARTQWTIDPERPEHRIAEHTDWFLFYARGLSND